ncbi:putative secondary metabolism biosyntheticenzyme [Clathrus columnatus]|uniref:Secondary metabolism biosyntheticenzyme n=1 Tax=Clathrus columnatus TaxID=1419009 RepID=A0AAV5ATT5_9AGAM|nr:putative secondary metabolism biosyntheticenzyme [Clathrus columnatus]
MVSSRQRSPLREVLDPVAAGAIAPNRVAVITGAASGIGRAAALELAQLGLKIALADITAEQLEAVGREVAAIVGPNNVLVVPTDVSDLQQVQALKEKVMDTWGEVAVLLNNAGIGTVGGSYKNIEGWHKVFSVNLWGVVNVQHTFVPVMLSQENPSAIINTGSKQGITNPPGNAAYNATKAAVKSLTESLAFELRQKPTKLTAHLFVPGWTHTGLTKGNSAEKPPGAWTATQTVLYMLERVRAGDFYILVPDNETTRELDQARIRWAAEDLAENRPALSRWHPEFKSVFEEYIKENLA